VRPAAAFNDNSLLLDSIRSALEEKDEIQSPTMAILMSACQALDTDDQPDAAKLLRTHAEAMAEFSKWTEEEVSQRVADLLKAPSDPDICAVSREVETVLQRCPQVTRLSFIGNENMAMDVQQGKAVFRAMATNTTIKFLEVANQPTANFGDRVADELASMVENNTTLETLSIFAMQLGEAGGIKLAQALEKNTTLRSLVICTNTELLATHDSVVAFARAIENNTGLQNLNMWYTSCHGGLVKDEDGALLGRALGVNTMLEHFDINGDLYTELSGEAFADALEVNRSRLRPDARDPEEDRQDRAQPRREA
jgi:hypothetical protein